MINNRISFGTLYSTQDILELASNRKIRWDMHGDSYDTNIKTLNSFVDNKVDIRQTNGNFILNLFDTCAQKLQKQLPQLDPYIKDIEKICLKFQKTGKTDEITYFRELDNIMTSAEKNLGKMIDVNTDELKGYILNAGKSYVNKTAG